MIGMANRSANSASGVTLPATRAFSRARMSGRSALARLSAARAIWSGVGPGTVKFARRGVAEKVKLAIFALMTSRGSER